MTAPTVVGILYRTVGVLNERGWRQHPSPRPDLGPVRILAATTDAGRSLGASDAQIWAARERLAEAVGVVDLCLWNDAPDQTAANVKAALILAAQAVPSIPGGTP
jgi:hypothetical protein